MLCMQSVTDYRWHWDPLGGATQKITLATEDGI